MRMVIETHYGIHAIEAKEIDLLTKAEDEVGVALSVHSEHLTIVVAAAVDAAAFASRPVEFDMEEDEEPSLRLIMHGVSLLNEAHLASVRKYMTDVFSDLSAQFVDGRANKDWFSMKDLAMTLSRLPH